MKLSRRSRLITALFALVSVLFMQLALSAYACPDAMGAGGSAVAAHQAMAGCTGMDMEQPVLCHVHDHAGHQSLDKPDLPHVAPFMPVGQVLAVGMVNVAEPPITYLPRTSFLQRITSPPLAIRNCCFRI